MTWRRLARWGVLLTGLGAVALVLTSIGTRPARVVQPPPERLDPEATVESTGAVTSEIRGVKEDYQVTAAHQFLYADGTSAMREVTITVKDRGGRDFLMAGQEARAGAQNSALHLTGQVRLQASDGFEIQTGEASYTEAEGLVRAPGPFTFRRGRMDGTGTGMTYDKAADVLTIAADAHVRFRDEAGAVTTEVEGGTASLDRLTHVLTLDRDVRALRGDQALESGHLLARLSEDNELVTFLELRGHARVSGGSEAFDALSAEAIDLAYTDDGARLDRVTLDGGAAVALSGASAGAPGRQFFGDHLDFGLAGGTVVTDLSGRGRVRLELPAAPPAPRRAITARQVLASGTPEAGLTEATFTSQVTFTETSSEGRARTVRSGTLAAALSGQTVSRAHFRGGVTFEEDGLGAAAADATYDPEAGTLALDGPDAQGPPRLEDARVSVSGDHIDVALDTHGLTARGHVRTTLRAETDGAQAPGLLDRGQAARVSAVAFRYAGADAGTATYSGEVQLLQGDSTIRAERLVLDPESGDLDAAGSARATFALENGTLVGRADRIHYDGAGRVLEYGPLPRATAKPAVAEPAQLNGPQGDLRAERITLTITEGKQALDRMDALGQVRLTVEGRAIRGARLRYDVAAERYDVEGTAAAPVTVTQGCDATTGRTLTWYRGTDRMLVDGREDARTRTTSRSGPCPEPRTP